MTESLAAITRYFVAAIKNVFEYKMILQNDLQQNN